MTWQPAKVRARGIEAGGDIFLPGNVLREFTRPPSSSSPSRTLSSSLLSFSLFLLYVRETRCEIRCQCIHWLLSDINQLNTRERNFFFLNERLAIYRRLFSSSTLNCVSKSRAQLLRDVEGSSINCSRYFVSISRLAKNFSSDMSGNIS